MELEWGAPLASAGAGDRCYAAALHLVRVGREIVLCWRRKSGECKRGFGISRIRQLVTLVYAAFRYNFPPSLYYRARLFRVPRERWLAVFSHSEVMTGLLVLERRTLALDVWSKEGWRRFCERHGLRTVPTFADVRKGTFEVFDAGALGAGGDLFIKPDLGWASQGTVLLEWQPAQNGWLATGARDGFVPKAELARFVVEAAGGADALVQPRLRTHAELADLSPRALANVRVVTVRSPAGRISLFSAALRIPWMEEHCSDVADGFFVPVNTEDGTLGHAEGLDMSDGPLAVHPLSGAPICGRVLSSWPEMRAQALAAHALLPGVPAVGWDLVPAETGVLILEANVTWSTNLVQLRGLAPLGDSAWPAAMLAYLADGEATVPAQAPSG